MFQSEQLSQDLIPYRGRPVYLRLVDTTKEALDYAAGGFHVSVARAQSGGCADSAKNFLASGTKPGACIKPLNRPDLSTRWYDAAAAYKQAYDTAKTGAWQQAKQLLLAANALTPYDAEGVPPPVDPGPSPSMPPIKEGVASRPKTNMFMASAFLVVGLTAVSSYLVERF